MNELNNQVFYLFRCSNHDKSSREDRHGPIGKGPCVACKSMGVGGTESVEYMTHERVIEVRRL